MFCSLFFSFATVAEEKNWFSSLFSGEPEKKPETLLDTYAHYRSEILEQRIYVGNGFIYFSFSRALRKGERPDIRTELRLNRDGMLAVFDLMSGLVKKKCGKESSEFDLISSAVPEQGIWNGEYIYVLGALEEEFNEQLKGICSI